MAVDQGQISELAYFSTYCHDMGLQSYVLTYSSCLQVNTGVYPPGPYYQGRFTNGFVWIDIASKILGQEVDNYACGGSNGYAGEVTVDPPFAYVTSPTRVPVRSLVQQVRCYNRDCNLLPMIQSRLYTVIVQECQLKL